MMLPLSPKAGKSGKTVAITGIARKGRRTKDLVKRLKPGDIAVIDHVDIDGVAAASLADAGIVAVVDAAMPISGKYPNRGPMVLAAAKIPLYRLRDPAAFDLIDEGAELSIDDAGVVTQPSGKLTSSADLWTKAEIEERLESARANIGHELEVFAENTLRYVKEEKSLLIEPIDVPALKGTRPFVKRHVVIVVRGDGYREDLQSIHSYIRDVRPILIGVDGGADALREFGYRPDIILGDMDSVTDDTLKCGAKLVVHAYARTREAPGMKRIEDLGLSAESFPVSGTSEDAAMLLAYEKGARLIVAVGTHSNLEDFLDKGRAGMASTFLVRLRVGSRLVDARGVSQLHRRAATRGELLGLVLSGGVVIAAVVSQSTVAQTFLAILRNWFRLKFH
ncbi:MAG TPA: putative cytokinetic ring protein SteA [Capsulimonadaceae bacterium]|jgi:uncharacterized membrane-anchored protein